MPEEHPTVEALARVFAECREEIIDEWRTQAGKALAELKLDRATLTDHVPDLVTGIIRDLSDRREGRVQPDAVPSGQPRHGVQRVSDGLDVGEVVEEFNLLRAAFFTIADRHSLLLIGEAARIISRRIDTDVRMAVVAFAERQAHLLKEGEDEHLAFIAHDLRTPLNAVNLLVDELKETCTDHAVPEVDELFESLKRNLQRVEGLIKRVLDAHAQPAGMVSSLQPERRTFELWPVAQRLIFDLAAVAKNQGVAVTNEIPRQLTVCADAGLIAQVFQNLLSNAFKYASRGRVTLTASEDADGVVCTVRDSGEGIPPEMLPKVFDKLATDPEKEGIGIGLAIVKQIVEAHGGSITAESTHGAGASFRFTLPAPSKSISPTR